MFIVQQGCEGISINQLNVRLFVPHKFSVDVNGSTLQRRKKYTDVNVSITSCDSTAYWDCSWKTNESVLRQRKNKNKHDASKTDTVRCKLQQLQEGSE
jgi:hypothetical protein